MASLGRMLRDTETKRIQMVPGLLLLGMRGCISYRLLKNGRLNLDHSPLQVNVSDDLYTISVLRDNNAREEQCSVLCGNCSYRVHRCRRDSTIKMRSLASLQKGLGLCRAAIHRRGRLGASEGGSRGLTQDERPLNT